MKDIKLVIALHIILGPLGVLIMMDDAMHPERSGDWWHNPTYAVPFCLAMEAFIVGVLALIWRKERRRLKGIRLLEHANKFQAEGKLQPAEAVFRKGKRMCGIG